MAVLAQDDVGSTARRLRRELERGARVAGVEANYARQLRIIARHIGQMIRGLVGDPDQIVQTLNNYADLIEPWARATAQQMLTDVGLADARFWVRASQSMGQHLRQEIEAAPTGRAMQDLLNIEVSLITSLPREAAERVQELATEAMIGSRRSGSIVNEIMASGEVARSRAETIARTEVARAKSVLTQARATHIGSTHYRWLTAKDAQVRPSHRAMQGKIVAWSDPPTLDGLTGHCGQLPNCRCTPLPILPETI